MNKYVNCAIHVFIHVSLFLYFDALSRYVTSALGIISTNELHILNFSGLVCLGENLYATVRVFSSIIRNYFDLDELFFRAVFYSYVQQYYASIAYFVRQTFFAA